MIGLDVVYVLLGLMFAATAFLTFADRDHPRRLTAGLFWALWALSFLGGRWLGDLANGVLALVLAALAGLGLMRRGAVATTDAPTREAHARQYGARLFLPALIIPFVALVGSLVFKYASIGGRSLFDPRQITYVSLALGVVLALAVAMPMLRASPSEPAHESRRLIDQVGWAALLPQMLAALGAVFVLTGVGRAIGEGVSHYLPVGTPLAAVCVYTGGMALFTVIMGNAFAAFPVMTAGVGLPLLVHRFGGGPAVVGAIGMLAGFSGTLVTPMAANFNIVPAALLDLPRYAVIRAQAPTAAIMLLGNTALMYLLAFHR
jgi:uncharacterized membrane protein